MCHCSCASEHATQNRFLEMVVGWIFRHYQLYVLGKLTVSR